MQTKTLPEPILITTQPALQTLVKELSRQPLVAVDTEANSLYAYRERVCLIQFSIPGSDYLVDPLALDDLSPLGQIFDHPEIEKIFHAAEYDLIVLKRDFDFSFTRLFDTMIAARILGWKSVGLNSILQSKFDVVVNKKYQRANWGQRPLPSEMLSYAQLDTHFLIPLRDRFKAHLESRGRWELAREDFRRVSIVDASHFDPKPVDCWRINGVQDLSSQQVAVLQELCQFRNRKAQEMDRPLFKVVSNKLLVNIAAALPNSLNALERVPGVSQKQVRWVGKELLAAVQRGLHKKPPPQPKKKRPSDEYLNRVDILRAWRKATAQKFDVESDVVLPKDLLYILADQNPQTPREMDGILETVPWRLARFGEEIFDLLRAAKR